MASKAVPAAFKIEGIATWEANILKQSLLSLGADAAIEREALLKDKTTAAFIFGSHEQMKKLCRKLAAQPFGLKKISAGLSQCLENMGKRTFVFKARNTTLSIRKPLVCGIINMTSDSFSGDGILSAHKGKAAVSFALQKAESMHACGIRMVDIGGESSRPFSHPVSQDVEIARTSPVVKALRREFKDLLISIDTYKYPVARAAADSGADIVNDISGLRASRRMAALVRDNRLGCILMHMKGTPRTMQVNPAYGDVVGEIAGFFEERLSACDRAGIERDRVLIDPGIGFGKRLQDNLAIIRDLYKLRVFGVPIFVGLSRKSFVGAVCGAKAHERLSGTIAASIAALSNGALILRAHDVKETTQAIQIWQKIGCN